jgi:hypothetical protein
MGGPMTAEQFRDVIASIESSDNPHAWGDHDAAIGLYQVHPAWVFEFSHALNVVPAVNETWNSWIGRIILAFYAVYSPAFAPILIAMHYHVGHIVYPYDKEWDHDYAARFTAAVARIGA